MQLSETLAPVVKAVTVPCPPERAFALFTAEIDSWWPTARHSIHGDALERIVWEPRVGGEVYELSRRGERARWATVVAWEPPRRLVVSWEVDPAKLGTEVEVRFEAVARGTRVELEHRGFENVREGPAMRASYEPGWSFVLERLAAGSEPGA